MIPQTGNDLYAMSDDEVMGYLESLELPFPLGTGRGVGRLYIDRNFDIWNADYSTGVDMVGHFDARYYFGPDEVWHVDPIADSIFRYT